MDSNRISHSHEYTSFRSSVTLKRIVVDDATDKEWAYYDAGPRNVRSPLIFMPPASGTADVFFRQIMALSAAGYRVISVEYPIYWTLREWLSGFRRFLDELHLDKVHIFGASLGAYFAQKFTEHTFRSARVHSLVLCNGFTDTTVFKQTGAAPFFWMMPSLLLKKMVLGHFTSKRFLDVAVADSIDFMVDKLDAVSQQQLASRLTLNCMDSYVEPQKLRDMPITVIDVFDECALSQAVRDEVFKCYPNAKKAHLKSGGNFPYLSRSQEVSVMIQVHLTQFENTRYSAREPRPDLLPEEINPAQPQQQPSQHRHHAAAVESTSSDEHYFQSTPATLSPSAQVYS